MKKLIVLFVGLMLVSCNETKIAYVDVEEVIKEYKGTKDAEKEVSKKSDELKAQLDAMAADYQKQVNDYYAQAKKMSNKKRQETEQALGQQQQILAQRQQEAQQQVQKEGQEKMDEINESVVDFVADYAKTNRYTYILGTSEQTKTVLYGQKENDITDIILDALNDDYKKNGTKKEAKEAEVK